MLTVIEDPDKIEILLPRSMDYYREIWREAAGRREAKLRPEEVEAGLFQERRHKKYAEVQQNAVKWLGEEDIARQ